MADKKIRSHQSKGARWLKTRLISASREAPECERRFGNQNSAKTDFHRIERKVNRVHSATRAYFHCISLMTPAISAFLWIL